LLEAKDFCSIVCLSLHNDHYTLQVMDHRMYVGEEHSVLEQIQSLFILVRLKASDIINALFTLTSMIL
jgi:hypothetical protein